MPFCTQKQDCGRELFTIDWSAFFAQYGLVVGTDTITSSVWTIGAIGSLGLDFVDGAVTSVFVEGGAVGDVLQVENTVEINNGVYRDCRAIQIEIVP